MLSFFRVVRPGFEPRLTEPKSVVLPLHNRTIPRTILANRAANVSSVSKNAKLFSQIFFQNK